MSDFSYATVPANQNSLQSAKIVQRVLSEMSKMVMARQYKEIEWYENSHAYQTIVDEYLSAKRSYDPNVAPELQQRLPFRERNMSDNHLPVEFAVVQRKLTTIMANLPKMNWTPMNVMNVTEREGKAVTFGYLFDYVWYLTNGDVEMFKCVLCSLIYGTGLMEWFHEFYVRNLLVPSDVDESGQVTYKQERRIVSQTRCRNKDIRYVLFDENALNVGTIERGTVIEHLGLDTFKKQYKSFRIEGVQPINPIQCFLKPGDEKRAQPMMVVELCKYYNEILDQYVLIANGIHINPYSGTRDEGSEGCAPIPSRDKLFPIAVFIDHHLDGEFYGMGEVTLAKPMRFIKNKTRNMIFDVMKKVGFPTLIIDPMSDFDEEDYEFGQPFVRAEPGDIVPIPINANLDVAINLDKLNDNDLSVYTGQNIFDTSNAQPDETATKTALRRESQNAMTENYMKYNMDQGFKRLWTGMKNSILLHYKAARLDDLTREPTGFKVRTIGKRLIRSQSEPGKIIEEDATGASFFETKPTDFADDYDLVLEMSNIAYTKELEKQRQDEALTFLVELGPQVSNFAKIGSIRAKNAGLPDDVIAQAAGGGMDLDQPASEIMKQLDLLAKPPTPDDLFNPQTAGAPAGATAVAPAAGPAPAPQG